MRLTLLISDLHLTDLNHPLSESFFRFLRDIAAHADTLYILGDLFEVWVGDDQLDHDPLARAVADALSALAKNGTRLFFMRGNRDFLIGNRFATEAHVTLLDDPFLLESTGQRVLLMHGDTLCTDDKAYQQFRTLARSAQWQQETLAKPYAERIALARAIRSQSDHEKAHKADDIMDVSPSTVDNTIRQCGYPVLIHGHTHRPNRHQWKLDGHAVQRVVIADWRHRDGQMTGGYLMVRDANWREAEAKTIA
jgi:UDP-2,3-diacylglucosamine hydrolase